MGLLQNVQTGERILLRRTHLFGRNAARVDTAIADPEVSSLHALVRWRDGHWAATDYSSNGTQLDGVLLGRGQTRPLAAGQQLRFGSGTWRVIELSPPGHVLLPLDPAQEPIALARHNLLPAAAQPDLCLYEAAPGEWLVDQQGELRPLADGDTLQLAGAAYRLCLAQPQEDTLTTHPVPEGSVPRFTFRVSLDEEHAWLHLRCGRLESDLGERSHHYCLVTLARRRLADAQAGFELPAQGWLASGQLAKMLGLDPMHLNIQVFRARDQVMNALPQLAQLARLVERRRGGLRLGDFDFDILRGQQLEGTYRLASAAVSALP